MCAHGGTAILGVILLPLISSNAVVKVMVYSSSKWKLMQLDRVTERLVGEIRRTKPTFPWLMYTRALLQSKDHSVGSKRYLSRLEKREESFASP